VASDAVGLRGGEAPGSDRIRSRTSDASEPRRSGRLRADGASASLAVPLAEAGAGIVGSPRATPLGWSAGAKPLRIRPDPIANERRE